MVVWNLCSGHRILMWLAYLLLAQHHLLLEVYILLRYVCELLGKVQTNLCTCNNYTTLATFCTPKL